MEISFHLRRRNARPRYGDDEPSAPSIERGGIADEGGSVHSSLMSSNNNSDDLDGGISVMSSNNSVDLDEVGGGEALPPEVWASVMQYLPFETILSCAATSRMILRNAVPLLKTLHIDRPTQMNLVIANRFRDVTEIHINCLLKVTIVDDLPDEPAFNDVDLDNESRIRVIPFLSRFDKLERLIFGGQGEDGEAVKRFSIAEGLFWEEGNRYPDEAAVDKMLAFVDCICSAFLCGALPKKLKVMGLCCPKVRDAMQHSSLAKRAYGHVRASLWSLFFISSLSKAPQLMLTRDDCMS